MYTYIYICIYIHICVCMYIYIYIYICMFISWTFRAGGVSRRGKLGGVGEAVFCHVYFLEAECSTLAPAVRGGRS